jgi:hypothetical protein
MIAAKVPRFGPHVLRSRPWTTCKSLGVLSESIDHHFNLPQNGNQEEVRQTRTGSFRNVMQRFVAARLSSWLPGLFPRRCHYHGFGAVLS